jgi:hypothetical protein
MAKLATAFNFGVFHSKPRFKVINPINPYFLYFQDHTFQTGIFLFEVNHYLCKS